MNRSKEREAQETPEKRETRSLFIEAKKKSGCLTYVYPPLVVTKKKKSKANTDKREN